MQSITRSPIHQDQSIGNETVEAIAYITILSGLKVDKTVDKVGRVDDG